MEKLVFSILKILWVSFFSLLEYNSLRKASQSLMQLLFWAHSPRFLRDILYIVLHIQITYPLYHNLKSSEYFHFYKTGWGAEQMQWSEEWMMGNTQQSLVIAFITSYSARLEKTRFYNRRSSYRFHHLSLATESTTHMKLSQHLHWVSCWPAIVLAVSLCCKKLKALSDKDCGFDSIISFRP